MTTNRAYRVYHAPEGGAYAYCGDFATLREAIAVARREPRGLEESLWATARAAGHCGGLTAPPDGGVEDDEPLGWYGSRGYHCVVAVRLEE